jgi:peptide/nickel transport system permease protein
MIRLITGRLALAVVTFLIVTLLVFTGTQLLPGDVAQQILGQNATQETLTALRHTLNLDQAPYLRYLDWLGRLFTGDLGVSLVNGLPNSELIAPRLQNTLLLAGVTAVVSVPVALVVGAAAAMRPESLLDRLVTILTLCVVSVPEFFLATVFVLIFAVRLGWLPAISYINEFHSVRELLRSLALPVISLSFVMLAQMARMTRAAILNVLGSPYIEMAILKGIPRRRIILRHALSNAVGPIANVVALNLAYLVGSVIIVETVFAYPGLSKLTVDAVSTRDMPLLEACAMIFCSAYLLLVLLADIFAIVWNPRLRHPGR